MLLSSNPNYVIPFGVQLTNLFFWFMAQYPLFCPKISKIVNFFCLSSSSGFVALKSIYFGFITPEDLGRVWRHMKQAFWLAFVIRVWWKMDQTCPNWVLYSIIVTCSGLFTLKNEHILSWMVISGSVAMIEQW